ncbi:MAG: PIN domain-containing protein [Nanoarchaeota archaeon]
MKLVINANILFSLAKKSSATSGIVFNSNIKLFSPSFAIGELSKYKSTIIRKFNLKENEFDSFIKKLKERIVFYELDFYKDEVKEIIPFINDEKDVEYLALSKKLNIPLWSNDRELKKQKIIPVFDTKEIIELLFS